MSSSSGNPPSGGGRMPVSFDPSLLQPIVRPKRTPMACVECRRRQVKCSGTTPRCERCIKKGIECTYKSLSEQRTTGGSISRSGTPQAAHGGAPAQGHQHQHQQGSRLAYQAQAQWPQDAAVYAAAQGWHPSAQAQGSSAGGQYGQQMGGQAAQGYPNAQMGYPQGYVQPQQGFSQPQGGVVVPGGADMYAQGGYGVAAQQAYANGTTYNAYGHTVPNMDPTYAYQAAQMGALPAGDHHNATYGGQYAQQMYFDPDAVQMMSAADAAAAQQWAGNVQGYPGHGFPGQ